MKIIKNEDLPQGSQEWLDVRSKYGMASEVSALLGVSKWDPKTPLALWNIKNGITKVEVNYAMEHGNKYEDEARNMFEDDMGAKYPPVVVLDNSIKDEDIQVPMGASLDGYREEDNTILVTTEKDYHRIAENYKKNINFLKIKVEIENRNQFIDEIKKII